MSSQFDIDTACVCDPSSGCGAHPQIDDVMQTDDQRPFSPDWRNDAYPPKVQQRQPRLQQMIEYHQAITSRPMVKLLEVLLQSCVVGGTKGCDALRPLWAEEAMHRAHNLLKLVFLLEQRRPQQAYDFFTGCIELNLAKELGNHYRSLAIGAERQVTACSSVLREVVGDLVALFGPTAGPIELHTDIQRVALPAYQRRALVLATSELVMNALLHAFKRRPEGRLTVELRLLSSQYARLSVSDDGIGCHSGPGDDPCGVAASLADLLGSMLIRRSNYPHGTIAEITFPLNNQPYFPSDR